MKLRTIRYSGAPVAPESLKAFNEDFKAGYDAIIAEHGQDMLVVHQELQKLDTTLNTKYNSIELQELPRTAKAWKALLDQFEAPIMLAKSQDNPNELVIVIVDQPMQ